MNIDDLERRIIIKLHGLDKYERQIEDFERCYDNTLFRHLNREWDKVWDKYSGTKISQKNRKPLFSENIGKEIVDTLSSFIFGSDKFPKIVYKTNKDLYKKTNLIDRAIENGDVEEDCLKDKSKKEKIKLEKKLSNNEINKLFNEIINIDRLKKACLEAARKSFIHGKSYVVPKFLDGELYFEVLNSKYIKKVKYHDLIPNKIISLSEFYLFEKDDIESPTGKSNYWHRRDFNEKEECVYYPIKENSQDGLPESFTWKKDKNKTIEHGFNYCPAVKFYFNENERSIFYGQLDNIKQLSFLTSDIFSGFRKHSEPQLVVLENESESTLGSQADQVNRGHKPKGTLWFFKNVKDVKTLQLSDGAFDSPRAFRLEIKKSILETLRLIEVTQDKNEKTATEVNARFSPTLDAIDEYRLYLGSECLMKLIDMICDMILTLHSKNFDFNIKQDVVFPESNMFSIHLHWGEKLPVTEDTIMKAITNALTAYKGGLIDLEHAVRKIAPFFKVMDIDELLDKLREVAEEVASTEEDAAQMYGRISNKINNNNKKLKEKTEKKEKEKDSQGES